MPEEKNEKSSTELVHPAAPGFIEKVTPKSPEEAGVFLFKCLGCQGVHFRHAGYVTSLVPLMRAGQDKTVVTHDYQVMVCVKCRRSFSWINEQVYELTSQIDLSAWEKSEKDLHKATGPGGQC